MAAPMPPRTELETFLTRARELSATVHVLVADTERCELLERALESARGVQDFTVASMDRGERQTFAAALVQVADGSKPGPLGEACVEELEGSDGGRDVSIGLATTAAHRELTLDELLAVALEGLDVARSSGAGGAVHSELYDLTLAMQRRAGTIFDVTDPVRQAPSPRSEVDDPFAFLPPVEMQLEPGAVRGLAAPDASDAPQLPVEPAALARSADEARQARAVEQLAKEIERVRLERATAEQEGQSEHDRLERRIGKLVRQLEDAQGEVERLRAEREADQGVPSRYKNVQGLNASDAAAPTKRSMLDGVYRANRGDTVT